MQVHTSQKKSYDIDRLSAKVNNFTIVQNAIFFFFFFVSVAFEQLQSQFQWASFQFNVNITIECPLRVTGLSICIVQCAFVRQIAQYVH